MAVNASAKADKSQERFENALRELFVGAKVEGESGFINLMRIKSRYYTDGVFPRLQQDIEAALRPFRGFRQELFDKLYDFFHRYFSPSGSIYFQQTPAHKNIYEKVYTDDRDVVLFWKHRSQGRQAAPQFRPDICPARHLTPQHASPRILP